MSRIGVMPLNSPSTRTSALEAAGLKLPCLISDSLIPNHQLIAIMATENIRQGDEPGIDKGFLSSRSLRFAAIMGWVSAMAIDFMLVPLSDGQTVAQLVGLVHNIDSCTCSAAKSCFIQIARSMVSSGSSSSRASMKLQTFPAPTQTGHVDCAPGPLRPLVPAPVRSMASPPWAVKLPRMNALKNQSLFPVKSRGQSEVQKEPPRRENIGGRSNGLPRTCSGTYMHTCP